MDFDIHDVYEVTIDESSTLVFSSILSSVWYGYIWLNGHLHKEHFKLQK